MDYFFKQLYDFSTVHPANTDLSLRIRLNQTNQMIEFRLYYVNTFTQQETYVTVNPEKPIITWTEAMEYMGLNCVFKDGYGDDEALH